MSETKFNPKLITLAREALGFSQQVLADKLNVSQSKVAKLEGGLLAVSESETTALAVALEVPGEFFFQKGPRRSADSGCFHHRKRQSLPVKDMQRIHAQVDMLQMQVEELLAGVAIDAVPGIAPLDIDRFDGDAESIARMVRSTWRLRPGPIPNLAHEIERSGGVVIMCRFGTDKIDAISQICPPLPALFYVNAEISADRTRHTLAHELGHLIMHTTSSSTPEAEQEADRFAAELLMPEHEIRPELRAPVTVQSLLPLKQRWRVSLHSLVYRAKALGITTEAQARSLYIQLAKRGWKKNEPFPLLPEEPQVIRQTLDVYRTQGGMSLSDLARKVKATEPKFVQRFFPGEGKLRLIS